MTYRGIRNFLIQPNGIRLLRGVVCAAPGANTALLFVAGNGSATLSRFASSLDHPTLHPAQLQCLG
jgi:hypothetical protein